ncbi:hypothetical protein scyTo_0024068, partial [Scyliorhinus torazame]|nr:hypothetical protein [Scyliorhinus torazame]
MVTAQPAPGAMLHSRFFSSREVAVHNSMGDLWVSFLGKVYDLSLLTQQFKGDILLKPILEAAGKDISHWFDENHQD